MLVGITMNPATLDNVVIVSASGGVDIEQVAVEKPEAIIKRELPDNAKELSKKLTYELAASLAAQLKSEKRHHKKPCGDHRAGVRDLSTIRCPTLRDQSPDYHIDRCCRSRCKTGPRRRCASDKSSCLKCLASQKNIGVSGHCFANPDCFPSLAGLFSPSCSAI